MKPRVHLSTLFLLVGTSLALAVPALAMPAATDTAPQITAPAQAPDRLPVPLARQVVERTIELVETKALLPRDQNEYLRAKADLMGLLDAPSGDIERGVLYKAINKVLRTLDVDGHSFIQSPTSRAYVQQLPSKTVVPPFRLVATSNGSVLHWTPQQIMGNTPEKVAAYFNRFFDDATQFKELEKACAVVVDLSEQKGGSAWPPFAAMLPLLGASNNAMFVDRYGKRSPFAFQLIKEFESKYAAGRSNPLLRFAKLPLAVVVGSRTASAGEMLLVALLGEGERVQTFGHTSAGMSTGNLTYAMPDGSALILTESRYAIGNGPVIHGGIPAAHPAAPYDSDEAIVKSAAEWAARQSPMCAGRANATAALQ